MSGTRLTLAIALASLGSATLAQTLDPQAIAADAARRAQAIAAATPVAPWGCVVLLCLANPKGPKAVPECVGPINQLWRDLGRGRPFPQCPMARGPNGGAWAQLGSSYYDRCPAGTTELPEGLTAWSETVTRAQSTGVAAPTPSTPTAATAPVAASPTLATAARTALADRLAPSDQVATGIGTGDTVSAPIEPGQDRPPKVCVGTPMGMVDYIDPITGIATGTRTYDRIVLISPARTPNYIDVILDSGAGPNLWSRVRY